MKTQSKQILSTDIINPSFKRSKYRISKIKPEVHSSLPKPQAIEKPLKLPKSLNLIPESVTHSDLIIPITTFSRKNDSKRSMSVFKLPSILQEEKFSQVEVLGRNSLSINSLNMNSRLSRMRKSINESMFSMNRRGILNPSANQLRVDSLIEAESFAVYFLFSNKSMSHVARASKVKVSSSFNAGQERKKRYQVLEELKSVVLASHFNKPTNQYKNLNDYLKVTLESIENCRSSIQIACCDGLVI
jgi:hypothetical protein